MTFSYNSQLFIEVFGDARFIFVQPHEPNKLQPRSRVIFLDIKLNTKDINGMILF